MSKRNVVFAKPEKPAFLKRIVDEIGYKEGPTVETKLEKLPLSVEDLDNIPDEEPVVVVLKQGDLSAEQVEQEKKKQKEKEEQIKADLSQRVVFCPTAKRKSDDTAEHNRSKKAVTSSSKNNTNSKLLSFGDEFDEEDSN